MIRLAALLAFLAPAPLLADIVVTTRTVRPEAILTLADLGTIPGQRADAFDHVADVVGQEARVALYPGRPIRLSDIGPPALVNRNQIVLLRYRGGGLVISTEGRSLERGGVGDRIRIMNLSSKATLFGYVEEDGSVRVVQ
ncbi:MAG: flagellar basal body P-ring formation chaperone FlgA [Pseudomonadota bacterium]